MHLNALAQGIEIWPVLNPDQVILVYRRQKALRTNSGANAMHETMAQKASEAIITILEQK